MRTIMICKEECMKRNKTLPLLAVLINLIGAGCLIYFAAAYLAHDTSVPYPEAMLPAQEWDRAGMALTFGFIPLLAANIFIYSAVRPKKKSKGLLFFIPSALCLILVISYFITSLTVF